MEILDFIKDNYVWIIIVGIVLIMTVIGYIAEKTNFEAGKKEMNKMPKEKNDEIKENEQVVEERTNEIEPGVDAEEVVSNIEGDDSLFDDMYTFDDEEQLDVNNRISDEEIDETPVLNEMTNNDSIIPEMEVSNDIVEETEKLNDKYDTKEESLETKIETESFDEQKIEDNNLEIELPNIETLNEEIKEVIDEDDVWKF